MTTVPRRLAVRLTACLAAATLGAACGGDGGTGPDDAFSGRYLLTQVNDRPLPFVYFVGLGGQRTLTSVELLVETRGRVREIRRRVDQSHGQPDAVFVDTAFLSYAVQGSRVLVTRTGATAATTSTDTADVTSTSLRYRSRYVAPGAAVANPADYLFRRETSP
jgi:hypothetical protein